MRSLCQFFRSPTAAELAEQSWMSEDTVLGCDDEQGPGPLFFFVPVHGGAVRVGVCPRHAGLLAKHHGTPGDYCSICENFPCMGGHPAGAES